MGRGVEQQAWSRRRPESTTTKVVTGGGVSLVGLKRMRDALTPSEAAATRSANSSLSSASCDEYIRWYSANEKPKATRNQKASSGRMDERARPAPSRARPRLRGARKTMSCSSSATDSGRGGAPAVGEMEAKAASSADSRVMSVRNMSGSPCEMRRRCGGGAAEVQRRCGGDAAEMPGSLRRRRIKSWARAGGRAW